MNARLGQRLVLALQNGAAIPGYVDPPAKGDPISSIGYITGTAPEWLGPQFEIRDVADIYRYAGVKDPNTPGDVGLPATDAADTPETVEQRAFREHREVLNRQLRAAYVAGAEEQSMVERGRGLTNDELAKVMAEYPGDLPTET